MKRHSYNIKPELTMELPVLTHGKGIYLYDQSGKRYIDGSSGAVTVNIGHAVDEIAEAMHKQAKLVSFAYRWQFVSEPVEQLADKLAAWAPGTLNYSFFVNSGSEAMEQAQKISIQYWQERGYPTKNKIISRWMSYHGNTLGALSMSGHYLRRERFSAILHEYPLLNPPYYYRYGEEWSLEEYGERCAEELETAILRLGADNIAAFVAEPIIGAAGGAVVPPPNYFSLVRQICDEYNVHLIVDEVMTGFGRTGKKFGMDHWNVVPDIMGLGKGMSAGYTPMAATVISDDIFETIKNGSNAITSGHTYGANPQSAATALAVIEYLEKHDLVRNAEIQGRYLMEQLKKMEETYAIVGDARGAGLLCALEFVREKDSKEPFPQSLGVTKKVIHRAFELGLLVYPASGGLFGKAGDAVLISPPLTVTREQIDEIVAILHQTIADVEAELLGGVR